MLKTPTGATVPVRTVAHGGRGTRRGTPARSGRHVRPGTSSGDRFRAVPAAYIPWHDPVPPLSGEPRMTIPTLPAPTAVLRGAAR
ncbi:hypothetical protein SUDANB6_02067 [Streptomyces sp. enrichment culture]